MNHARCNGMSSEIFYPVGDDAQALAIAGKVCEECPVQVVCAAHALTHGEQYGFWGGLSENDRRAIWSAIRGGTSVTPWSMRGRARTTVERTFGEAGLPLLTARDASLRVQALRSLYVGARTRAAGGQVIGGVRVGSKRQPRHRRNTSGVPAASGRG
ncbi:MAG TPA: WhiB family transcriptional regulator [Mycobacteriales bacterium]|jgi:WhiB family redox-sensing transcriptional regulator